jgi:hypothetical protein
MADRSEILQGKRGLGDVAFEKVTEDFATRYASTQYLLSGSAVYYNYRYIGTRIHHDSTQRT